MTNSGVGLSRTNGVGRHLALPVAEQLPSRRRLSTPRVSTAEDPDKRFERRPESERWGHSVKRCQGRAATGVVGAESMSALTRCQGRANSEKLWTGSAQITYYGRTARRATFIKTLTDIQDPNLPDPDDR